LRSFAALWATEPGFRVDSTLTTTINLPRARYQKAETALATIDRIEERLAAVPGVQAVGATSHLPLSGRDSRSGVAIEGREPTPDTPTRMHPRSVSAGYFRVMGITLATGRGFLRGDDERAPQVAVVNEAAARKYWPGGSPIGKRFRFNGNGEEWREIVGVVRDVRHWGLTRPANPEVYMPVRQEPTLGLTFVLGTHLEPAAAAHDVRTAVQAVDGELVVSDLRSMRAVAAESVQAQRAALVILVLFGLVALVLASAGIYGVMAHLVAQRNREIGIRLALGARPRAVIWLILRDGLVQASAGLAIGLAGAVVVMRSFRAFLYEVSPGDPLTFVAVAVLLLGAALVACLVPSRRAMRVDPIAALRAE